MAQVWQADSSGSPPSGIQGLVNRIYNPNWLVDQINEGGLYTIPNGTTQQIVDAWTLTNQSDGTITAQRVVDPDNANLFCLKLGVTIADAVVDPANLVQLRTTIEGYDVADLGFGTANAGNITITIPIRMSLVGTYGVHIYNSANNRYYIGTITQDVANVWEYKTLTLAGDTLGTWLYNNSNGLILGLCLMGGTTYQTASGVWAASGAFTTAAQSNFMGSIANVGYIGRVQLVPGSNSIPYAAPHIQTELQKLQRYYWKTFKQGTAVAQNAGFVGALAYRSWVGGVLNVVYPVRFPVVMRTTPTIIGYNPSAVNANWRNNDAGTDSGPFAAAGIGDSGFGAYNVQVVGDLVQQFIAAHVTANARLS